MPASRKSNFALNSWRGFGCIAYDNHVFSWGLGLSVGVTQRKYPGSLEAKLRRSVLHIWLTIII